MADAPSACTHRPPCPGCPRLFEAGLPAGARELLSQMSKRAGIEMPELVMGEATGFRHRARLAVRGRKESPKVGIFQRDSHRIVDIPNCLVHHPLINRVAAALKRAIRATKTVPYADGPHLGDLRSVQIVVERSSQRAQVVLVGNADRVTALEPLCEALAGELGDELHSLWWNGNPARSNTILGSHWQRIFGPDTVCESIGGAKVFYPPGAFGQSNLDLADRMTGEVSSWIPDAVRVVEFYAGCGALGLGLVDRCRSIAFNEVGSDSLRGLALGIAALDPRIQARTEVHPGIADEARHLVDEADVVVADPPRKGLGPELLSTLCESPAARFVYVSCGLDALVRDAHALLDTRRVRLRSLSTYALVRHSDHVETVAVFDRV